MALNELDIENIIDEFVNRFKVKKLHDYDFFDFLNDGQYENIDIHKLKKELEDKGYQFIEKETDDSLLQSKIIEIKESISNENIKNSSLSKTDLNDYYKSVEKYKVLNIEEERDLINKIKFGNSEMSIKRAKEKFICSNWRLVLKYALEYRNKGVDLIDLINVGNEGLIRALSTYNPSLGKFSTYATPYIKKNMHKAIRDNLIIHIPDQINELLYKIKKYSTMYYQKFGTKPNNEQLTKFMNDNGVLITSSVIAKNEFLLNGCLSIDNKATNEDGEIINNGIEDMLEQSPTDFSNDSELLNKIFEGIKKLPTLEQSILLMYLREDKTFNEIKKELNLSYTTEYIRIKYHEAKYKVKQYVEEN